MSHDLSPRLVGMLDMKPGIVLVASPDDSSSRAFVAAIGQALALPAIHSHGEVLDAGRLGSGTTATACVHSVRHDYAVSLLRVDASGPADAVRRFAEACIHEGQSRHGTGENLFPAVSGLSAWGLFCLRLVCWEDTSGTWQALAVGSQEASLLGSMDPARWPDIIAAMANALV